MDNRYNRHNRRKYSLKVHIVLVTKYRKQLLKGTLLTMLNKRFLIYVNLKNGKSLLWRLTKTISIFSQNTMQLTGYVILLRLSSRKLRIICGKNPIFFSKQYWKKKNFWSDGYFACSIGEISSATIQKYIESQVQEVGCSSHHLKEVGFRNLIKFMKSFCEI